MTLRDLKLLSLTWCRIGFYFYGNYLQNQGGKSVYFLTILIEIITVVFFGGRSFCKSGFITRDVIETCRENDMIEGEMIAAKNTQGDFKEKTMLGRGK